MNTIDNSKEPLKSSASPSGSLDEEVNQKKAILELSNSSILHGYDMAIDLLMIHNQGDAAEILKLNRIIIEIGLKSC